MWGAVAFRRMNSRSKGRIKGLNNVIQHKLKTWEITGGYIDQLGLDRTSSDQPIVKTTGNMSIAIEEATNHGFPRG